LKAYLHFTSRKIFFDCV